MGHDRRSKKPTANKNSAEKFSRIKEKEGWLYKASDITFNKKKKIRHKNQTPRSSSSRTAMAVVLSCQKRKYHKNKSLYLRFGGDYFRNPLSRRPKYRYGDHSIY